MGVSVLSRSTLHEKWLVLSHGPVDTLKKNSRNVGDVVPGAGAVGSAGAVGMVEGTDSVAGVTVAGE